MRKIEKITADQDVDEAYDWLCRQRRDDSHNSDIWDLRWNWKNEKPAIQGTFRQGLWMFSPTRKYHFKEDTVDVWGDKGCSLTP